MSRLPNFFIIGAPKAGTTSLYHYLDQHPQIYMSPIKEPCYFASELRPENYAEEVQPWIKSEMADLRQYLDGPMTDKRSGGLISNWDDYRKLFQNTADARAIGEASVSYLWSATAAKNIAAAIPDAKILVMLRDPAERAFSQYLQCLGYGAIRCTFREFVQLNLHHQSGLYCAHYPLLEFGLYSEQLSRYLERFGRNVWIGFHEDFKSRPLEECQNICRFLGVAETLPLSTDRRHREAQVPRLPLFGRLKNWGVWQAAARSTPQRLRPLIRRALIRRPGTTRMNTEDRKYLIDYYREDIAKLALLLDRNLDGWLQINDPTQ